MVYLVLVGSSPGGGYHPGSLFCMCTLMIFIGQTMSAWPWVRSPGGASSGWVSMMASLRGEGAPVAIISHTSMPAERTRSIA